MDTLLLGMDAVSLRSLRECLGTSRSPKPRITSLPLKNDEIPENRRWDVIFLDERVRGFPALAEALKKEQIEGLKIIVTDKADLRPTIDFWGTSIYSYLLKPVDPEPLRMVWRNVLERIRLRKKLSLLDNQRERLQALVQEHNEIFKDMFVSHLEMQELNRKKTNFLAQTAHELGTPLTALQGFLELLSNGKTGPVNELQLQLVNRSLDSCRRLAHLASSLMDLSALDRSGGQLRLRTADISECISGAVSELSQTITARGLNLKIQVQPGIPQFRFDPDRLHQVFANLLDNACKFTPVGGSINIYCGPYFWERRTLGATAEVSQERRQAAAPSGPNCVRTIVEDTGTGIAPEHLRDIFEPYFRERPNNGSRKGFGLGLAVANQIVLAHQGKIWAESEPGHGSSFFVLIPTSL